MSFCNYMNHFTLPVQESKIRILLDQKKFYRSLVIFEERLRSLNICKHLTSAIIMAHRKDLSASKLPKHRQKQKKIHFFVILFINFVFNSKARMWHAHEAWPVPAWHATQGRIQFDRSNPRETRTWSSFRYTRHTIHISGGGSFSSSFFFNSLQL